MAQRLVVGERGEQPVHAVGQHRRDGAGRGRHDRQPAGEGAEHRRRSVVDVRALHEDVVVRIGGGQAGLRQRSDEDHMPQPEIGGERAKIRLLRTAADQRQVAAGQRRCTIAKARIVAATLSRAWKRTERTRGRNA